MLLQNQPFRSGGFSFCPRGCKAADPGWRRLFKTIPIGMVDLGAQAEPFRITRKAVRHYDQGSQQKAFHAVAEGKKRPPQACKTNSRGRCGLDLG